jgi:phosphoglucosamine mutase
MFGTSGIRGPVGEVVTASLALRVGRALGVDTDRVTIGRDPRESGELLTDALAAGLRESGTDVIDLGLAATPTVARAVAWHDADAGVSVTASHNPPADNGIKLWQPSGQAFDETRRERIATRVENDEPDLKPWDELGTRRTADAAARHVEALVENTTLDGPPPTVAIDLGNGAGGPTVEALMELGCRVETLNAQPDGRFPARPSEPNAETLGSLCAFVAGTDCDLGLAHDGDADRLVAVDSEGEFVPKDALLAIFAGAAANPGERIACPVDTSLVVADYLAERDIGVEYTPVGDVYVAAALGGSVTFGGEPSGAWIWPDETLCPDGPLAASRLVALCADRSLADRVCEVPSYPIERANVECEDERRAMVEIENRASDAFDSAVEITTLDGVRIDTDDGWLLVRASGTQPLIRVTGEARSADRARTLVDRGRTLITNATE